MFLLSGQIGNTESELKKLAEENPDLQEAYIAKQKRLKVSDEARCASQHCVLSGVEACCFYIIFVLLWIIGTCGTCGLCSTSRKTDFRVHCSST